MACTVDARARDSVEVDILSIETLAAALHDAWRAYATWHSELTESLHERMPHPPADGRLPRHGNLTH